MIAGAARELALGDPREPATHVGPVIDAEAKDKLDRWIAAMEGAPRALPVGRGQAVAGAGHLRAARDHRARSRGELKEEVFGPILHVVRWRADELDALLDDIAANGYGLTLGIHSRIDATVEQIVARLATRQCLRQSQHDRGGGRHAAVRRQRPLRHRAEGGRPELSAGVSPPSR